MSRDFILTEDIGSRFVGASNTSPSFLDQMEGRTAAILRPKPTAAQREFD
jgi:hypothetical protein